MHIIFRKYVLWGLPRHVIMFSFFLLAAFMGLDASAHGVAAGDKGYIQEISGINIMPFIYLGAVHDHGIRSNTFSVWSDFLSLPHKE